MSKTVIYLSHNWFYPMIIKNTQFLSKEKTRFSSKKGITRIFWTVLVPFRIPFCLFIKSHLTKCSHLLAVILHFHSIFSLYVLHCFASLFLILIFESLFQIRPMMMMTWSHNHKPHMRPHQMQPQIFAQAFNAMLLMCLPTFLKSWRSKARLVCVAFTLIDLTFGVCLTEYCKSINRSINQSDPCSLIHLLFSFGGGVARWRNGSLEMWLCASGACLHLPSGNVSTRWQRRQHPTSPLSKLKPK